MDKIYSKIIIIILGSFCGSLSSLKASDLGSIVIKESLERASLKASHVSEVILGQVKIKITKLFVLLRPGCNISTF